MASYFVGPHSVMVGRSGLTPQIPSLPTRFQLGQWRWVVSFHIQPWWHAGSAQDIVPIILGWSLLGGCCPSDCSLLRPVIPFGLFVHFRPDSLRVVSFGCLVCGHRVGAIAVTVHMDLFHVWPWPCWCRCSAAGLVILFFFSGPCALGWGVVSFSYFFGPASLGVFAPLGSVFSSNLLLCFCLVASRLVLCLIQCVNLWGSVAAGHPSCGMQHLHH